MREEHVRRGCGTPLPQQEPKKKKATMLKFKLGSLKPTTSFTSTLGIKEKGRFKFSLDGRSNREEKGGAGGCSEEG